MNKLLLWALVLSGLTTSVFANDEIENPLDDLFSKSWMMDTNPESGNILVDRKQTSRSSYEFLTDISSDIEGDNGGVLSFKLLVKLSTFRSSDRNSTLSAITLEYFEDGKKLGSKSWDISDLEYEEGISLYETKKPFSSTMMPVVKLKNPNFSPEEGGRVSIYYDESVLTSFPKLRRSFDVYLKDLDGKRWALMDRDQKKVLKRIHFKKATYWGATIGISKITAK
jgi:hypothetical protein